MYEVIDYFEYFLITRKKTLKYFYLHQSHQDFKFQKYQIGVVHANHLIFIDLKEEGLLMIILLVAIEK